MPVSVLLSDELDLLLRRSSLLLEGCAKGSSSSRMESRVKLSWVEEMSLRDRESVIFSKNLWVVCMSSISLWHSCSDAIFIYREQISYWRSKADDYLARVALSSDLEEEKGSR